MKTMVYSFLLLERMFPLGENSISHSKVELIKSLKIAFRNSYYFESTLARRSRFPVFFFSQAEKQSTEFLSNFFYLRDDDDDDLVQRADDESFLSEFITDELKTM